MKKKETQLTEAATKVEAAHVKAVKSRKDLKNKRALFMKAQLVNQANEAELAKAKEALDQQLTEKV